MCHENPAREEIIHIRTAHHVTIKYEAQNRNQGSRGDSVLPVTERPNFHTWPCLDLYKGIQKTVYQTTVTGLTIAS